MSCCSKRTIRQKKKFKRNTIFSKDLPPSKDIPVKEYIEKLSKECSTCHHCKNIFNLRDMKISCGKCNQLFHCYVAGKCRGYDCSEIINGEVHSLSYCFNCVNPMTCNGNTCLCNNCEIKK